MNWVEGGENSASATWILNAFNSYKRKRFAWDNTANWRYGVLKSGENDFRKNEDRIEAQSKLGYNASKKWYYSALVQMKTQFFKGYSYPNDSVPVSAFMSPGYIVSSLGMDYKPNDSFTIMMSPLSVKTNIVSDTALIDQTKYGLGEDQRFKSELGAYMTTKWKWDIHENIIMVNKLELFSNYKQNPENIDVDWEMNMTFKATKFINTSISTHLIYDHDVDIPVYEEVDGQKTKVGETKAIQFKELLSVGFSYKF